MNRRRFLGAAALAASAVASPAWISRAFAAGKRCGVDEEADLAVVSAGYRAAQRAGRPLLCLIVPEDDGKKWERGRAFGELLNHGSDEQLAPLGRCDVIACRMAPLRRLVPAAGAGEPLMVLVDTAAVPAAGLRLDAELPQADEAGRGRRVGGAEKDWRKAYEEQRRREDAVVERRIATLARLCREAVVRDRPIPAEQIGSLAADVRARLVKGRVPGSRWAHSAGCGTTVEGDTNPLLIGCGMGHVPEKSARFLYFFSHTPAERQRAQSSGEPCGSLI